MTDEIKLKSCPFCGSNDVTMYEVYPSSYARCRVCGAEGGLRDSHDEAAAAWNSRTDAKGLVVRLNVSDEQVRRMVDEAVSAARNRRAIDRDELLKIAEELEAGYGCRLDEYHSVAQFAENAHEYERGIAYLIREAVGE